MSAKLINVNEKMHLNHHLFFAKQTANASESNSLLKGREMCVEEMKLSCVSDRSGFDII